MSAALAIDYGAVGIAAYNSPKCSMDIKNLANGVPIRHALDCIVDAESSATCFAAIARTGGRYACLEALPEEWRTRQAIRVKVVMGFEGLGATVDLGPTGSIYSRQANEKLFETCARWHDEMQSLMDEDLVKSHPVREVSGGWQGIIDGLEMLQRGEVRGQKLVVKIVPS
jgi:hypothetical protein